LISDEISSLSSLICFSGVINKDNIVVNICYLNDLIELHQKAEIGIWLLPEHWGKGIFQEVMTKVVAYGFKELNLHRIEAFVESGNTKCRRAIAKTGFTYEGTMKDCEQKDGKWISLSVYAILNP